MQRPEFGCVVVHAVCAHLHEWVCVQVEGLKQILSHKIKIHT